MIEFNQENRDEIVRLLYFLQDNMYIKLLCNHLDDILDEFNNLDGSIQMIEYTTIKHNDNQLEIVMPNKYKASLHNIDFNFSINSLFSTKTSKFSVIVLPKYLSNMFSLILTVD